MSLEQSFSEYDKDDLITNYFLLFFFVTVESMPFYFLKNLSVEVKPIFGS